MIRLPFFLFRSRSLRISKLGRFFKFFKVNGKLGFTSSSTQALNWASLSSLQLQALEVADPVALDAALNAIDRNFGSFLNYRRQALHVSNADVARLQKQLLECRIFTALFRPDVRFGASRILSIHDIVARPVIGRVQSIRP
jgi:hypothetical protein